MCFFFFQAEDGIRDDLVTGVQTCALPICDLLARAQADRRPGTAGARPITARGGRPLYRCGRSGTAGRRGAGAVGDKRVVFRLGYAGRRLTPRSSALRAAHLAAEAANPHLGPVMSL